MATFAGLVRRERAKKGWPPTSRSGRLIFPTRLQRRAYRKRWADAFLEEWKRRVIWFAPLLKDKAFAAEREWRLIVTLGWDLKNVKIQQRQSLISRHLPLSFGLRVPLKSVMVGPCRNPNVSRVSVGTILNAKGYPVDKL